MRTAAPPTSEADYRQPEYHLIIRYVRLTESITIGDHTWSAGAEFKVQAVDVIGNRIEVESTHQHVGYGFNVRCVPLGKVTQRLALRFEQVEWIEYSASL